MQNPHGLLLLCLACGSSSLPEADAPDGGSCSGGDESDGVVRTESGLVRGDGDGAFKGIPYAAPPVGERRWRPPAAAPCWDGVREATGFGYVCMQPASSGDPNSTPVGSEDCLTLNVWSPEVRRGADLPVFVFVHGGYFTWGSSSRRVDGVDIYDGSDLASRTGAVVVTINYRVGALGFVGHRQLGAENEQGASGNYGLLDQIAALSWVQRNVAGFGGDPDRVLVFGQSAGAISVASLYASPLARGLFAAAIMHSGGPSAHPIEETEAAGDDLARALGCDDLACMRSRSASEVVAALPESFGGGFAFGPTVDGLALPDRPLELVRAGLATNVPLIVGVTADEFTTMIQNYAPGPIETAEDMRAVLEARHGAAAAAAIMAVYPPDSYPTPRDALIAFFSDVAFVCPSRRFARAAAEHAPVRRFVWSHTYDSGPIAAMRAGHGLDLPFVFRNFFHHEPSARELALAGAIAGAWGRFAAGGDPGPVGGVDWPAAGDDSHLVLAPELSLSSGFRQAQCDHWDRVMDRP